MLNLQCTQYFATPFMVEAQIRMDSVLSAKELKNL
jgi:hypothetical protein